MEPLQQNHHVYGIRCNAGNTGKAKLWINCLFFLLPAVTSLFCIIGMYAFKYNPNLKLFSAIVFFIIFPLTAFAEFIGGIIVWLRSHSRTSKSAALSLILGWFLIFTFVFFPYSAPISCVLVIIFLIFSQKISQFKK
jgi:hypothetical protein